MAPRLSRSWLQRVGPRWLPFADAASATLPLRRLLRLSLFQLSVGMAAALLTGTLNRIMIVELQLSALLVAASLALPLLAAPWRARIGYRSDTHRSFLGWRRVPYLWLGTLLQFGGLAILPFALLLLGGGAQIPLPGAAEAAAVLALLMVGLGMQTTQTAGLALATDQAPEADRPRVVALMYLALLVGMLLASLGLGGVLRDFSATRLVAVVQGAALLTLVLNGIALWKQEPRNRERAAAPPRHQPFAAAWAQFIGQPRARRFLVALGLGTAGFAMQDLLLEPYGGLVLQLPVAATSALTALAAAGALLAFALAARRLQRGADPFRLAAVGLLTGVLALATVVFAGPLQSKALFALGTGLLGLGSGLFAVATLVVAMQLRQHDASGLALGAWGAVQAGCAGLALLTAGLLRDGLLTLLHDPLLPFSVVYHLEIGLLFAALVALGPLVRRARDPVPPRQPFGLADFPG